MSYREYSTRVCHQMAVVKISNDWCVVLDRDARALSLQHFTVWKTTDSNDIYYMQNDRSNLVSRKQHMGRNLLR